MDIAEHAMPGQAGSTFPGFFDEAPRIRVRDPLAAFLGAAEDGIIEYTYADAVKLAGHSCPTVAGAYLMCRAALAELFADELPERGAVRVSFREAQDTGVTGVMANVASLVTGAAGAGGFKGIGGRFDRRHLLTFSAGHSGEMRVERTDLRDAVEVAYRPEIVPAAPRMRELLERIAAGSASDAERREFGVLWQERVKRILLDFADHPELVVLTPA